MSANDNISNETPNQRLGGFELLEQIGEGGMGVVYRAKQTSLDRLVALKVLNARLAADEKYLDSFRREARSAARLSHSNIIPVFDAGQADGSFYYAMEFVNGETLSKWVRREGALPETTALEIALCVAGALKYAWEREQLIHRDIKPENIIIDTEGNVKICDLGLAKNFGENTLLSLSGQAFGTPNYMSPEQARAERGVDFRSDIYSLGLTLYFALTNEIPFHGGTATLVMARHMTEQLPDPRAYAPNLSPHVCRLLQKMAAKNVADRYQNWDELIADIQLIRAGQPPAAQPLPIPASAIRLGAAVVEGEASALANVPQSPILPFPHSAASAAQVSSFSPPPSPKSRAPIYIMVAAVAVIALGGVGGWFFFKGGNDKSPTAPQQPPFAVEDPKTQNLKPPDPPPVPPPPPVPALTPERLAEATLKMTRARQFAETNPTEYDQTIAQLTDIAVNYIGAPEASEALQLIGVIRERQERADREARERQQAEERRIAEQRAREEEARAKALAIFNEAQKSFLDSLAKREYAEAENIARAAADNPLLESLKDRAASFADVAKRLRDFWSSLPQTLAPLKGKQITVQSETGVFEGIAQGSIELEKKIGDSGVVITDVPLAKVTAEEFVTLITAANPSSETLLSLGWFLFAENKPAEAAEQFDAAEKAGADVKTARELLAFISKGALEIEAEKLLSRLRALVQNRQWQQAQSELRTIQRQYAQTFAIQSAQQELANIEATLAASQLATAVGAQFKPGSEVKIFEGHTSTVVSVAMSEDLKWVLTGSNDGTARLWEAASGKQLHLFRLTSDRSTTNAKAVALTPDGRLSIVLGSDSTLRVWDNQTGEQRLTVPMAGQHCMAVHPDGKRVLTGGSNNTLKLWDIRADKLERELNTRGTPGTCGFSADGRIFFSTHHDGTIRLWETDTGRELKMLQAGPSSTLVNGALSPDARYAATWGWSSKTIKLWDLSSDTMIREMLANSDAVTTAVFSRDGRFLISGGRDNSVRVIEVATGSNLLTMGAHRGPVHAVAVSADGRFAVSGSNDGTARLWMLWGEGGASPQAVALAKARAPRVIGEFRYAVRALDLTPDGRYALGGSTDSSSGIKIWEIATGREVRVIKSGGVTAAAFSPDGRFIISGGGDGLLTLWDANTGASLRIFKGFSDTINDLKFTPDGRFVLGCSFGKLVRVWDTQSTNVVASYSGHSDMVISLAVSPDGKTAASASKDKTVRLWEIATGKELQVIRGHGDQVWCVAFSPNGRLIASGGADNAVHIRDANNGALLHRMEGHGLTVRSVAFSPDSRYVLSGSVDKTLRLWEVATGKLLKTFEGSAGVINRVKFSPDGRFAVSGGEDKNVMVWNLFDAPLPTSPPPTSSSPTPPSPAPSAVDTTRMPDGNFVKPKRERTPQTFLKVVSKQGDFIGQGKDYVYGEQELNVSGNDQNILARAGGWRLNIAPPPNQALKVGEYLGAKRTAFRGDAPGIDFGGNGRGSNKIEGRFVIWELEVVSGQITRLALDFVQHSENANAPPLFGSLRFNSNYGDDPEKTTSAPLLPFIPQPNIQRPPAPPSAPAANTDEELRQRVFALVRQLDTGLQTGSGRIAENDLVRIGAPALPHLREAANSSAFPMHKSRIESVIQKIEGNLDATTPTAPDAALPQFWLSEIGVTVSLYQNRALLIHDVQSNSIAAAIGLRTGDIISHINDQPTKTHEEFQKLFAEGLQQLKERDAPVRFRVMRGAGIFKPSWRGK